MKYTAAVLLLAMACVSTYAQEYSTFARSSFHEAYSISPLFIQALPAPVHVKGWGRGRRTVGPIMVGTGVAMGIGGAFIFSKGREESREWHRTHPGEKTFGLFGLWDSDKEAVGAVIIGAGIGLIPSGLVLWIKGVKDGREYKERYGTSSLQLHPGLTTRLTYSF